MPNVDQWTRAVQKLVQLTEDGKLNWNDSQFPASLREEVLGNAIYGAIVEGRWVAAYEYRYKSYSDIDTWDWCDEVAIEFVKHNGDLEWRWPTVPYRVQLLDAIRAKVCGAHDFLKHFLEKA